MGVGGGTNAVLQKELTSIGDCFTNDKFKIDKKPIVAFCGFLMYDKKINQHKTWNNAQLAIVGLKYRPKKGEQLENADMKGTS